MTNWTTLKLFIYKHKNPLTLFFIIGFVTGYLIRAKLLTISNTIQAASAVLLAYFTMQQVKINKTQLDLTLEALKPRVIVKCDDWRDIFIENAGSKPVFHVNFFAKRSQVDEKMAKIGMTAVLRPEKPLKIEPPDDWKENLVVIDWILNFSTEPTGKGQSTSGHFLLLKPE